MCCRLSILLPLVTFIVGMGLVKASDQQVSLQYRQASACVDSFTEVHCAGQRKIAIRRVVYGAKRVTCPREDVDVCCVQKREDCFVYHDAAVLSMNIYCSGHRVCTASTRITSGLATDVCIHRPSYSTILYDCILDKHIVSFGTSETMSARLVFVSNAGYPDLMQKGNETHVCLVISPSLTNIKIQSIDMVLTGTGFRPRVCDQILTISELNSSRETTYTCTDRKYYGFYVIYESRGIRWTLTLQVNDSRNRGRLWLALYATDDLPLTVKCTVPAPTISFPTTPMLLTPKEKSEPNLNTFSIGVLSGCIAVAITVALLVVALITCQCHKRKVYSKRKRSVKSASGSDVQAERKRRLIVEQFPDVCGVTGQTSLPISISERNQDIFRDAKCDERFESKTDAKGCAESVCPNDRTTKLKKKVSFKDILEIREDEESSESSQPNSFTSGNSFYTFGKVDDDIDDELSRTDNDFPPPPDWICSDPNPSLRQQYPYIPETSKHDEVRYLGFANCGVGDIQNLEDFYKTVMTGRVFDDSPPLTTDDDLVDKGPAVPIRYTFDNGVVIIENALYEPSVYIDEAT